MDIHRHNRGEGSKNNLVLRIDTALGKTPKAQLAKQLLEEVELRRAEMEDDSEFGGARSPRGPRGELRSP